MFQSLNCMMFAVSTHSRLKAAGGNSRHDGKTARVSTHSRLKAAGLAEHGIDGQIAVSTHSRLKAAGPTCTHAPSPRSGFNTQPPEGGWALSGLETIKEVRFQHTAA